MGIYDELSSLEDKKPAASLRVRPAQAPSRPVSATAGSPAVPAAPASAQDRPDVMEDVTTSAPLDDLLKSWREVLENTETHNSAFRLSSAERDAIEDLVLELRRSHRIKSSMNELARLGLLVLLNDYRTRGTGSVIHRVKKP